MTRAPCFCALTKNGVGRTGKLRSLQKRGNAEGQSETAMSSLPLLLQLGAEGAENDVECTRSLRQKAIGTFGHTRATVNLGLLPVNRESLTPNNATKAKVLFEMAIKESNDADVMVRIDSLLARGRGRGGGC